VDQQATRKAKTDPGATISEGSLNSRQGVTTFLKVTGGGSRVCRQGCSTASGEGGQSIL